MDRSATKGMSRRCVGCERVGQKMSREHFYPLWLIERARITRGINWATKKGVDPRSATVPLCETCNNEFGAKLESPVAFAFDKLEKDLGITDYEAELLVRWLWKAEGISWTAMNPRDHYSSIWTLRERALGAGFRNIRAGLSLAIALVKEVDTHVVDLPLGFDSPAGYKNSIFMSGVFCHVAIMCLLSEFSHLVPPAYSIYQFPDRPTAIDASVFFPERTFVTFDDAIEYTSKSSAALWLAHERLAAKWSSDKQNLFLKRTRIELAEPEDLSAPFAETIAVVSKSLLGYHTAGK